MSGRKIYTGFLVIALLMLVLSSVSFSLDRGRLRASFVVKAASPVSGESCSDILRTAADIRVGALTGSVVDEVEANLREASDDIYRARVEERNSKEKAVEVTKTAAEPLPASNADLSGIERQVLDLINQIRAQHGLSQLAADQSLTSIARSRCQCMISNNYFSHYAPDGSTFFTLLKNNGISYRNAGENLGNAKPAGYGSPQAFLNAWMNSPSHRDNMLRSNYRLIGVGVIDGGGRRVVTTIFLN